ncbi:SPOSA6832_03707, partial [Sporobolomyces salmonicolor]
MSDIKQTVLSALGDVGHSFDELAKSLGAAQDAISDYVAAHSHPALFQVGPLFALPASTGPTDHALPFDLLPRGDVLGPKSRERERPKRGKKKKDTNAAKPSPAVSVKDPNAPKRPPPAYLAYQNSVASEFRTRHPAESYPEVLKRVSQRWKAMSGEQKKVAFRPPPWIDQYEDKRAEYTLEREAYEVEHRAQPVASTSGGGGGGGGDAAHPGTGTKRGRKSTKEKEALSAAAAPLAGQEAGQDTVVDADTSGESSPRSRPSEPSPPHNKRRKGHKGKTSKSKAC